MADPTLATSAVGRTRAPPDKVELRFEASATEPNVTGARRAVADRAARLRGVLDETGVPDERVRTTRFRVGRQSRGPHGREHDPESRPFEATETVGVTLHDLDALGDVLAAAVDDADAEIGDVTFTFRTETKRELEREALEDAVETARRKADAAASAEGLTVGDVRSMTTENRSRARRTGTGLGAAAQESGNAPTSGPIDVTVTVEIEYELLKQ